MFGRKRKDGDVDEVDVDVDVEGSEAVAEDRADGPFDIDEAGDISGYLDLGAVRVPGGPELSVRLEMDQATGKPAALTILHRDGAVQLRAFAAPRSGGLWEKARQDIATQVEASGGTAEVVEGPFGTELRTRMPVPAVAGQPAGLQQLRIVGAEGPRWLLQGIFMGTGASPGADPVIEDAFRSVVVVRGAEAMPSGAIIPFTVPPDAARPASATADPAGPTVESLEPGARITEIR